MSALRPELASVVDGLLRDTSKGGTITLDAIGDAIGTRAASAAEIDVMLSMLEAQGRHVVSPEGGGGESKLKSVLDAARALRAELGRPPRHDEIAARAGISREDVQHALALARIMQR